MAKQIKWTKVILETFLEESGINDRVAMGDEVATRYESIIRTRFGGWTIVKQANELNVSIDTVKKNIREIKDLYDQTQKHSLILPIRKKSKYEEELDKES